MGERLVFEVADRELDLGVLAMLSVDRVQVLAAVGQNAKCRRYGKSSV